MIGPLLRVGWISLKRDRAALFLTFVLPIVFFSIFALVTSSMGGGNMQDIDLFVLVVDLDDSEVSRNLVATLGAHEALSVSLSPSPEGQERAPANASAGELATGAELTGTELTGTELEDRWTRETAHSAVRAGEAAAAIVLPAGLGETFGSFGAEAPEVELIYDASNPMAQFTIAGLLQAASFQSSPDVLMEKGLGMLEQFGGELTPQQRQAMTLAKPMMAQGQSSEGGSGGGLLEIEATAAHDEEEGDDTGPSMIAYYAAGIGVMFLLFSMTGAAGGLLEEEERGTLERLLTSNVSMSMLLGSRWVFFTVMGTLQVLLMFVWGSAAFGLDLWSGQRVAGVLAMSVATAAAAASFGLVLAAACKSRAQLGGLSTIVVLVMSALGGSMMPRFIMPDFMSTVGKFTLNGWALDGFLKVFWYGDPEAGTLETLRSLVPELLVLTTLALVFFIAARRLARRWEVV